MGLEHIAPLIEADAKKQVYAATWGHLFPKDDTYFGTIRVCTGIYGENCILSEEIHIDGSPWWYETLQSFVCDFLMDKEEGVVYEIYITATVVLHKFFWEPWECEGDEDVDITVPYKIEREIVITENPEFKEVYNV